MQKKFGEVRLSGFWDRWAARHTDTLITISLHPFRRRVNEDMSKVIWQRVALLPHTWLRRQLNLFYTSCLMQAGKQCSIHSFAVMLQWVGTCTPPPHNYPLSWGIRSEVNPHLIQHSLDPLLRWNTHHSRRSTNVVQYRRVQMSECRMWDNQTRQAVASCLLLWTKNANIN